jgi:hypothetical protein
MGDTLHVVQAEDRATVGTDLSAVLDAKTEEREELIPGCFSPSHLHWTVLWVVFGIGLKSDKPKPGAPVPP